jgi:hypothetical protein
VNAVAVLVDAINELATTGRLSDDTRRAMSDAVQAADFGHPGYYPPGECHYEEMESERCPICEDGRRCADHRG